MPNPSCSSQYNLPPSNSLPAVGSSSSAGRQSPTPSSSSSYHQRHGSRLSSSSLTSPGSALPGPSVISSGRQLQSAFTSGVLPARGFFAPQRPGDARRLDAAIIRAPEPTPSSTGGGVEMITPSRFDPKPLAGPTVSETSIGHYASSRQPSENGSIDPSSIGEPRGAAPMATQTGSVAYKGSREPLLDFAPAGHSGSTRLHPGPSPKLPMGSGSEAMNGGEYRKGSAMTAGIGSSPFFPSSSASPRLGTQAASQLHVSPFAGVPNEKPTQRVKAHTLHDSANVFALGGRLVTGGDSSPFPLFASLLLEVGVGAVWIGTTGVGLWQDGVRGDGGRGGIAVVVLFLWLWGISLGAMLGTVRIPSLCLITISWLTPEILLILSQAFRDPGILPRNLDPSPPRAPTESTGSLIPLPRDLRVRSGRVTVKYCETCRIYRPPRASHCRICDNCVDGIDHHCAYLHNCVGRNNYTSFIAFLVFTVLSLAWVAIWSAIYLWRAAVTRGQTFRATLGEEAGSGVVFCLSLVLLLPVGSLMSYHVWVRLTSILLLPISGLLTQSFPPWLAADATQLNDDRGDSANCPAVDGLGQPHPSFAPAQACTLPRFSRSQGARRREPLHVRSLVD